MQTDRSEQDQYNAQLMEKNIDLQEFNIMHSDSSLESQYIKPQLIFRSSPQKQNKIQNIPQVQGDSQYFEDLSPLKQSGPVNMCPHVPCTLSRNEELLNQLRSTGNPYLKFCKEKCKFNFCQPLSNILKNIQEQLFLNQLQYIKKNPIKPRNPEDNLDIQSGIEDQEFIKKQFDAGKIDNDEEYYKVVSCRNTHCEFFFFQIEGEKTHYCPQCLSSYQL